MNLTISQNYYYNSATKKCNLNTQKLPDLQYNTYNYIVSPIYRDYCSEHNALYNYTSLGMYIISVLYTPYSSILH